MRLPVGTYSAMTFMDVHDGPDAKGMALLGNPEVDLDQDRVVELDASTAVPVEAKVGRTSRGRRDAHRVPLARLPSTSTRPSGCRGTSTTSMPVPTDEVTKGDFEFVSRWRLRKPSFDVSTPTHRFDVTQAPGGAWLRRHVDARRRSTPARAARRLRRGSDVTGKAVVITRDPSVSDRDAA